MLSFLRPNPKNSLPSLSKRSALIALLLIAPVPTLGVWFAAFSNTGDSGSLIWAFAKIWLLIGPLIVWLFVQRQPFTWPIPNKDGLKAGLASGLVLAAVIILAYVFIGRQYIDFSSLKSLLVQAGIQSKAQYLYLALYLTLVNSLIEEYVFRWFMFQQLSKLMKPLWAVIGAALIFTFHHTVVLAAYIPWHFNVLASVGVFTGGLIWSGLYFRYGRIWPAYASHIGADVGVFVVGYFALFSS